MKNFFLSLLITSMIIPQIGLSQTHENHNHEKATAAVPHGKSWKPVNKFSAPKSEAQSGNNIVATPPLTNVLNGVSFYTMNSVCNSEKVILIKLINSNNYPVKVSWKVSEATPAVVVEIPAKTDFEGQCSTGSNDANKANLVVKMPQKSEKEAMEKQVFSSLTVSELK